MKLSRFAAVCAVCLAGSTARAQTAPDADGAEPPAQSADAARTVDTGAFMPLGLAARGQTQRAYVSASGGYDGATGGAFVESAAQGHIAGGFSLRAGFGYRSSDGSTRPSVLVTMDLLSQQRHGIDLAVYAGYQGYGFNTVPAVAATVALGRSFGRLSLLANVGYGLGVERGEHYGEARVAGMVRVHRLFSVGLDARARLDLERDADEPTGEPDWDVVAGPQATLNVDRVVVGAGGGVAATKFRDAMASMRVGPTAYLTLGVVF